MKKDYYYKDTKRDMMIYKKVNAKSNFRDARRASSNTNTVLNCLRWFSSSMRFPRQRLKL